MKFLSRNNLDQLGYGQMFVIMAIQGWWIFKIWPKSHYAGPAMKIFEKESDAD